MSEKNQIQHYNLLDEKWIPVLYHDGKTDRIGIKEALTQAGRIRQIAASNPMDRVAILRFLLALLYWCKGSPEEGSAVSGNSFPEDWFSKLDTNSDCFNLLGEGKRFYQCISPGSPKKLTVNYLIQEIPTGTNTWHFRHSIDKVDGLCPGCCAMGLLRLPLFATSGGRTKPPGINAKPPIYAIPMGDSLASTIRLSWLNISDIGTPAWEQPDLQLPNTGNVPLLTGFTWLPRRVWLDNPYEPEANCISCGRKGNLIYECVFAGIGSTKTDEGDPIRIWSDPHVIYEQNSKGDITSLHAGDALGSSDASVGQWTRIMAGLLREKNVNGKVWVVGFSTVQNDKYLEAMEYFIPIPSSLQQDTERIVQIERWRKESRLLEKRIGGSEKKRKSSISAIRPHVEGRVSSKAGELLTGSEAAWETAALEYNPMMNIVAKSISPGFTSAAVKRRNYIAGVTPDMRPKPESAKKSSPKKGDDI